MTLIVAANGRESIWLLGDRRLTGSGCAPYDEARKLTFLETTDGVAILGYCGLGATARGTQPSDWISAVLRGRKLTLEESLGILAGAVKRELPRHMVQMPVPSGPTHNIIVPAFLAGEVRLYTIDLVFAPNLKDYRFRWTRHVADQPKTAPPRTPRVCIGGSGAIYLNRNHRWIRRLLHLIKASDQGKASPRIVSNHLAEINNTVHLGLPDKTVGHRCIVAWRNKRGGVHKDGGGHQFYTGTTRDRNTPSLPTIANGMDVHALVGVLMPNLSKMAEGMRTGEQVEWWNDDINKALARLPDGPDEKLR